jgi:hypothetical protein
MNRLRYLLILSGLVLFSLLVVIACRLTAEEDKQVHTLTLESLYDSLKTFDNVQIQIKDAKTNVVTVIFNEKVDDPAELRNLAAPGYDGKAITIIITATNGGVTVYLVEREFEGSSNTTIKTTAIVTPNAKLIPADVAHLIYEGDTLPLPAISVRPANLADTTLVWKSLDSELLAVHDTTMIGISRGVAKLQVKLRSDPGKELVLDITVAAKPSVPDTLHLSPKTFGLAAKGASKKVKATFIPVTADPSLFWRSSNEDVALVSESGSVVGLAKGSARISAASRLRPGVSDTVTVTVTDRVPATNLRFTDDTLIVFVGGAAAPLVIEVAPALANSEADFIVRDPSLLELLDDKVKAKAEGVTYVIGISRDNPALKDSIRVEMLGEQRVESLVASPELFPVYTGGKPFQLTAQLQPASSYAKVQWRALNPEWATVDALGRVSAVAPGLASIECVSLADSSKKDTVTADVKQDPPTLRVGRDTTVNQGQTLTFSPVVDQDYGGIANFKWDVDGVPGYEDSADGLKPVSFKYLTEGVIPVQFYVRDGEGNWDTAQFKVTVKPSPIVVDITIPSQDTSVNTPEFKVRYTVNGTAFERIVKLQDGTHDVVIDSSNEKGSGRDSVKITLDTVAPVIRIISPTANQAFNKDSVAVVWTVDGNPQTTRLIAQLGNRDGNVDVIRDSTDRAGNKGIFKVTVSRDTKPPKVTISSPKDSTHVKTAMVAVAWAVDSVAQRTDTTALKDGLNLVKRRFTDPAGNTDSAFVRVYYHSKPPAVKILTPSDSTIATTNSISVSWIVDGYAQTKDTLADLKTGDNPIVRVYTDEVGQTGRDSLLVIYNPGATNVKISSPLPGTVTNLLFIPVAWSANGVDKGIQPESLKVEGENLITRKFQDGTQLEGIATVKVIRDTQKPNAPTLNPPAIPLITTANPTASVTWTWFSGGDNLGGAGSKNPKAYRYILDDGSPVNLAAETFTLGTPADGVHSLEVQEQDQAGNWSISSTVQTIIVDKTPPTRPTVSGLSPSSDPVWTWTSGGGGNGTFRYRMDGAAYAGTTKALRYNPAQVTDVDHVLYVQEQDDHGNWSAERSYTIFADNSYPTVPSSASYTCTEPGSETDTVQAEMDSEGYHSIFDGNSLKGWWPDCKTSHSSGSPSGAIIKVDPNSRALFMTQSGGVGGVLMTNKQWTNYELVMDIWPKFGNDAGIYNRSTASGRCFQTTMDYLGAASVGGTWGEGGFPSRYYEPFAFSGNDQTIMIPGNSNGDGSNWTTITSTLNPTSYGCAASGCVMSDWQRLWNFDGWNEMKVAFYGGSVAGSGNVHMKAWFRKSGADTWVPLSQDTTFNSVLVPKGYVGIEVHGAGRFGGAPGNWYRNIKIRELNDFGEPLTLP